jgi:hypothetical protein
VVERKNVNGCAFLESDDSNKKKCEVCEKKKEQNHGQISFP